MNWLRRKAYWLGILLLAVVPAFAVAAQGILATPDPATAPIGVLAEFPIRTLANPHAEVWFTRAHLDPGGRLPLGVQIGQTVFYVESGSLSIEAEGAVITEGGGLVDAVASRPMDLEVGTSLMLPRTTEATAINSSDEPATFLVLMMYSAMDEGEGGGQLEEPVGLTQVGLSIGAAEFYPAPGTVTIERIVVEPGDSIQNVTLIPPDEGMDPGWMGIDLGTVESGTAEVGFEQSSFQNITWPPMMSDQFPQPVQVPLSGKTTLSEGEAYAAFASVLTISNTGEDPLVILRVIVSPRMGP